MAMLTAENRLARLSHSPARSSRKSGTRPGDMWAALCRTVALWRHRARTRAELRAIPTHQLNDLPFDTSATINERAKPFWKP